MIGNNRPFVVFPDIGILQILNVIAYSQHKLIGCQAFFYKIQDQKIGFMRNGQRIWSNIRIVDVDSEVYVNANRVNVQYVYVEEDYGGGKVYTYKVPVFMTYETN